VASPEFHYFGLVLFSGLAKIFGFSSRYNDRGDVFIDRPLS
jgi:hypothetical protein